MWCYNIISVQWLMAYNGAAVKFSLRFRTGRICHLAGICPGAEWRIFCNPGTEFFGLRSNRGTSFVAISELSKCNKCYKNALVQYRGISSNEAGNLSRCFEYEWRHAAGIRVHI